MRRVMVWTAVILSAALATAACGGGSKHASRSHGTPIANASAARADATTTDPAQSAAGGASAQSGTASNSSKTSAAKGSTTPTTQSADQTVMMPSWFTVAVDKACVHPEDTQGFTVHGGVPGQPFIYDVAYADGTDDFTSHYGTGSGTDKFDNQGGYRKTFVLAGKVPPGTAYLTVASTYKGQIIQTRTSFVIKPVTEKC